MVSCLMYCRSVGPGGEASPPCMILYAAAMLVWVFPGIPMHAHVWRATRMCMCCRMRRHCRSVGYFAQLVERLLSHGPTVH